MTLALSDSIIGKVLWQPMPIVNGSALLCTNVLFVQLQDVNFNTQGRAVQQRSGTGHTTKYINKTYPSIITEFTKGPKVTSFPPSMFWRVDTVLGDQKKIPI